MSAKTERFLSLYRTYEGLVRAEGADPKDIESTMAEPDASRMTMARQFRNFLAHVEAPGYLEPTENMLRFLDQQVKSWAMRGDVVKKHLKSPTVSVCGPKDTCAEAVTKLSKLRRDKIAVQEKNGAWFVADVWMLAIIGVTSKTAKACLVKPLREKVLFVAPSCPITDIPRDRVVLCTDDGTETGKVLGTVVLG